MHPPKRQKTYKSSFSNRLRKPDTCTSASSPTYLCSTARLPKCTPSIALHTPVCYVQLPMNASRHTYLSGIGLYPYVHMCPILTYVHVPDIPIGRYVRFRQYCLPN